MDPARKPIMCTATETAAANQLVEWERLQGHASNVRRLKDGVAMTFDASLSTGIAELVQREAACCSFLSIETTRVGNELRLEITSDNPDARPVIDLLAGEPS